MRDLVGIELFTFGKRARRAAADFSDEQAEVVPADDLTAFPVACLQRIQAVVVEEVA